MAYAYKILVNGVARYVGKGRGRRAWTHVPRAIAGANNTRFYRKLAKAISRGAIIEVRIIKDELTDKQAYDLEIATIAKYKSQLWNTLSGGQGISPKESKRLLAELWADPSFRKRSVKRLRRECVKLWEEADEAKRLKMLSNLNRGGAAAERGRIARQKRWVSDGRFRRVVSNKIRCSTQANWDDPVTGARLREALVARNKIRWAKYRQIEP